MKSPPVKQKVATCLCGTAGDFRSLHSYGAATMSKPRAAPPAATPRPGVSRRRALVIVALAPAMLGLPLRLPAASPASSAPRTDDPEARLRRALADMRLPFPASLDLVSFALEASDGRTGMAAVVRMTWAPGMRQRRFAAEADGPERALATLIEDVRLRFSAAA